MSQRGNGMMAHMDRPGKLTDALDHIMLGKDPASPIPEAEVVAEVVEVSPEPPVEQAELTPPAPKPIRRTKTEQGKAADGVFGELTSRKRYKWKVVTLNTRIDDRVVEAVEATRRQIEDHLKKKGPNIKAGKQDVVNQALFVGLNLTPPEGWEPL
jgi:hypothetical protein